MYWHVSLPRHHGLSAQLIFVVIFTGFQIPIRQRIVYKQCLMTYKAVHRPIGQRNYLNELIQPYQPVRTLRSPTSALLVIPFVRSDFASDAFSVSSPTLWNNLPQDVRSCANQATFKSRLKSHLFSLAFTV